MQKKKRPSEAGCAQFIVFDEILTASTSLDSAYRHDPIACSDYYRSLWRDVPRRNQQHDNHHASALASKPSGPAAGTIPLLVVIAAEAFGAMVVSAIINTTPVALRPSLPGLLVRPACMTPPLIVVKAETLCVMTLAAIINTATVMLQLRLPSFRIRSAHIFPLTVVLLAKAFGVMTLAAIIQTTRPCFA